MIYRHSGRTGMHGVKSDVLSVESRMNVSRRFNRPFVTLYELEIFRIKKEAFAGRQPARNSPIVKPFIPFASTAGACVSRSEIAALNDCVVAAVAFARPEQVSLDLFFKTCNGQASEPPVYHRYPFQRPHLPFRQQKLRRSPWEAYCR